MSASLEEHFVRTEWWSVVVLEYWSVGVLEYWSVGVLQKHCRVSIDFQIDLLAPPRFSLFD
jgi:hypothetical protein